MYRFLVVMCAAANCVYGSTLSPPRLAQLRETLKDHQEACVSSANDQLFQLYLPWMRKQMKQDSSLFPTLLRLGSRFEDPALRVSLLSSPIHPPPLPSLLSSCLCSARAAIPAIIAIIVVATLTVVGVTNVAVASVVPLFSARPCRRSPRAVRGPRGCFFEGPSGQRCGARVPATHFGTPLTRFVAP